MNNRKALEVILSSHQHRAINAAECIGDFIEDEAATSLTAWALSPALNHLWGFALDTQGMVDVYTMFLVLREIDPEFANTFADTWDITAEEICKEHECHPHECATMHDHGLG